MDVLTLKQYETLSPFEIKDFLAKAAIKSTSTSALTYINAGRGNRNNEVNDDRLGLIASGELNPPKSRVLLMLALTKTRDVTRIQQMFYEY